MPLVYYVSDLEKNGTLDAERLLRLLGVSGKLSGFYYAVYMLEQVREKPECILLITKRLYRQTAQFFHTSSGDLDGMATEQGYYALAAYYRFVNAQTRLYDMTDVTIQAGGSNTPATGDTGVTMWVVALPVAALGAAFVLKRKKREE